jgi:hypothetical protein
MLLFGLLITIGCATTVTPCELPTISWISAGTRPGEAIFVGIPEVATVRSMSAQLILMDGSGMSRGQPPLSLPVLQQGNGSVVLHLPIAFRLSQWGLQLCREQCCSALHPLYAPDVQWFSCESGDGRASAACNPTGSLRVFGRRMAFDENGCRAFNRTSEPPQSWAGDVSLCTPCLARFYFATPFLEDECRRA